MVSVMVSVRGRGKPSASATGGLLSACVHVCMCVVVTHSSGNHGRAVAAAAKLFGVAASVVVPDDTPANKISNIKSYGAVVVTCEPTQTARIATCNELAQSTFVRA